MKRWIVAVLVFVALVAVVYGVAVVRRGFSATDQPSGLRHAAAQLTNPLRWAISF